MRGVYTVEQVRAAEDALMARLPDGALMDAGGVRAGGASARALLGPSTARGSCCSSAPATTAATRCTPVPSWPGAGRAVTAVLLDPERAHPGGLAALRRAGGRVAATPSRRPGRARPTW